MQFQILYTVGNQTLVFIRFWGQFAELCVRIYRAMWRRPFYFKQIIEQIYTLGMRSFPVIAFAGLATGSVMALQFGYGLAKFGGKLYIPEIVAITIFREMGPIFTALLMAGRVGSGIAAEVASMQVTQQIDAIRALGTSPIKTIVIPRVIAATIALPVLTIFANYIALFTAMLVSQLDMGIHPDFFLTKAIGSLQFRDFMMGVTKATVFGFFIAVAGCMKGLGTDRGTQGVGLTTTRTVVVSSIFIMISDFFIGKFFLELIYPSNG